MAHAPQGSHQQSSFVDRFAVWFGNPFVVFAGSTATVFISGSLVLILIWLFSGPSQSTAVVASANPERSSVETASANSGSENEPPAELEKPKTDDAQRQSNAAESDADSADQAQPPEQPATAASKYADAPELLPFHRLTLPDETLDYGYAPATGTLAVAGPWGREVGFISNASLVDGGTADDVKLVKLPGTISRVDFKPLSSEPATSGGVFVVGYSQPAGIVTIDPATLEIKKRLSLEENSVGLVSCASDPNAKITYLFTYSGDTQNRTARNTYAIDTEKLEVITKWSGDSHSGVAAHDGTWFYRTWRGPLQVFPPVKMFSWGSSQITEFSHSSRKACVDPRGRFVAIGKDVYSPDFQFRMEGFEFEPTAVSAEHPWMAGIDNMQIVFGSLNTGKASQRFKLPDSWLPEIRYYNKEDQAKYIKDRKIDARNMHVGNNFSWADVASCQVFADDKHKRFVLCSRSDVLSFPYDKIQLPDEPNLLLSETPPKQAELGQPLEYDLKVDAADVEIALDEPIPGAAMTGNTFRWTPSESQAGKNLFIARIRKGSVTHYTRFEITATRTERKPLDLPFAAMSLDVSSDQSKLLVLGYDRGPDQDAERIDVRKTPGRLIIIDLATKKIVGDRKLPTPVWRAVFCGNEILVSRFEGEGKLKIVRLKAGDLSVISELPFGEGYMRNVADRFVAVGRERDRVDFYALPKYERLDRVRSIGLRDENGKRMADGWTMFGALWDESFKTPKLLFDSLPFVDLSYQSAFALRDARVYTGFVYDLPRTVKPDRGINTLNDCHVLPANLQLRVSGSGGVSLAFIDLQNNEVRHSELLMSKAPKGYHSGNGRPNAVWTNDKIFTMAFGKVYEIDLNPIRPKFPRPFYIAPQQSTFVLKGKSVTVSYRAEGATEFTLRIPGLDSGSQKAMDSSDGSFTIEMPDLDKLAANTWPMLKNMGGPPDWNDRLARYLQRVSDQYQRVTGRRPSGCPVVVQAQVSASGSNLQTAFLRHCYLIDIPRANMLKNVPKK